MAHNGIIIKTTNGGLNWSPQNSGSTNWLYSIQFVNSDTGFIVGSSGEILKTTTGGEPIGIHNISTETPENFSLSQNYPNPFNPTTKIQFSVPSSQFVVIKIFDVTGREVATLVNEGLKPGTFEVEFDGSVFSSGIYFYKLSATGGAAEFIDVKKMILLR